MGVRILSDMAAGQRLAEEATNLARRGVSRICHTANVEPATGQRIAAGRLQPLLPAGLRKSAG